MIKNKFKSTRPAWSYNGAAVALASVLFAGCSAKTPETEAVDKINSPLPSSSEAATAAPQAATPSTDSTPVVSNAPNGPQTRTVFFRAESAPTKMPTVAFTKHEAGLNKVNVGDKMPAISLPKIGGDGSAKLSDSLGKKATVVVLWQGDRRMALEQLADLGPDVGETFGKDGVALVGIAVNETAASAADTLKKAEATFPNLLDADGKAFAEIGSERLPRTYLLDPEGKIVWFDIEYSHATRRELHDALRALTGAKQE